MQELRTFIRKSKMLQKYQVLDHCRPICFQLYVCFDMCIFFPSTIYHISIVSLHYNNFASAAVLDHFASHVFIDNKSIVKIAYLLISQQLQSVLRVSYVYQNSLVNMFALFSETKLSVPFHT